MHPRTSYYLYAFLNHFAISQVFVIYALYLLDLGLGLGEIILINAAWQFTIVISEVPTGVLADGRGRVWSLRAGVLVLMMAMALYACASGFWMALAAEVILGIGASFLSGADEAWITDALHRRGESHLLPKTLARSQLMQNTGMLLGSTTGALLSLMHFRVVYAASAVLFAILFLFTCFGMNGADGEPMHRVKEWDALRQSLQRVRASEELRWLLIVVVGYAFVFTLNHWWTPFAEGIVGRLG
ncbi:MFS transporter, partial [Candidatus Uhrbacteria bacterium]|nr:MFS transporter [Candidatus Uhrbacteria bacterium]MBD3284274.1 MFS transporter [Candidatus Uhrbacteria bacterium]